MKRTPKRSAFTLIELLTVMAIITLLIGILTPALGAARDRARSTAVRAQLNAMEVGLEAFHQDEGKYPPSNAVLFASDPNTAATLDTEMTNWEVGTSTAPIQGAHILVDALVGRDFLGYDPKPSTTVAPIYDRWAPDNSRRQPYIPVDGVDVSSVERRPEDAFGKVPTGMISGRTYDPQPMIPTTNGLICRIFRDKFGWPILYYRTFPAANSTTPIVTASNGIPVPNANYGNGAYDGEDNAGFTSYTNSPHKIKDATIDFPIPPGTPPDYGVALSNKFAEFIRSIRASTYDNQTPPHINFPRPVKADRFILLSPGKDGIFGNLDDVANFQAQSLER